MKKYIIIASALLSYCTATSQNNELWTKVDASSLYNKGAATNSQNGILAFHLNQAALEQKLVSINDTGEEMEITVPNTHGELETFMVKEYSNFEPELQAKYPNIRAYSGVGKTDKKASMCISVSPIGIQTSVFRSDTGSEYIVPSEADRSTYFLRTSKNRTLEKDEFVCSTLGADIDTSLSGRPNKTALNDRVFRTFRLALSCTGEYARYFGSSKTAVMAAFNATLTRINGIFNKDLALKVVLIKDNDKLIYTDPNTDPYTSRGSGGPIPDWNTEVQRTITSVIGNGGYDIGHLFGRSGGGGNAGCLGCVCVDPTPSAPLGKGSAFSSAGGLKPEGDEFDVFFVAHEMGHQFGSPHTFSFQVEGSGAQVEVGSGSTIMGYAGITGPFDVQPGNDDYYSFRSLDFISFSMSRKTCQTSTQLTNRPPTISGGPAVTIPMGTPFILTGTGSDPDGDTVTYTWEDGSSARTTGDNLSFAISTKPDGPLFRSLYPSSSPVRYMPALQSVLDGRLTSLWESVPGIARPLPFVLTARDNAPAGTGQTNFVDKTVTVANSGPFQVSSQNTQDISWKPGAKETVTWAVNGTSSLPGSANVNIKLSIDGGKTFPTTLVANTPNDGTEQVTVPSGISSTNCRLWIEPTGNIYYSVNKVPFSIGATTTTTCKNFTIPSSNFPETVSSSMTVITRKVVVASTTDLISKVSFKINLSHSNFPQTVIEIISPKGTKVNLFDSNCFNTRNATLDLNFDDTIGGAINCNSTSPQNLGSREPLSIFNGENPTGTWTINITDYNSDRAGGKINSASLTVCTKSQSTLATQNFEIGDFVLYPNPNKGNFNIKFTSQSTDGVQVQVLDLLGRKVFEKQYESAIFFDKNIELPNYYTGTYLISVTDGDRKTVKKLIVE